MTKVSRSRFARHREMNSERHAAIAARRRAQRKRIRSMSSRSGPESSWNHDGPVHSLPRPRRVRRRAVRGGPARSRARAAARALSGSPSECGSSLHDDDHQEDRGEQAAPRAAGPTCPRQTEPGRSARASPSADRSQTFSVVADRELVARPSGDDVRRRRRRMAGPAPHARARLIVTHRRRYVRTIARRRRRDACPCHRATATSARAPSSPRGGRPRGARPRAHSAGSTQTCHR